ncbi:MAG: hypothetical protein M0R20_05685 [Candidatus Omnitrophica bacterium]|jgi:hypothetical protein|nr:hypothetical protein [Candidatus Omnitrophota bacterium]
MEELPITSDSQINNPRWSYLYAYNIKILRDILVYCAKKRKMRESALYSDMAANKIPPPKSVWISKGIKRKERLRLEYVHASEYLGLIRRENGFVEPNFKEFEKEKRVIISENSQRKFDSSIASTQLTEKEKQAFINILSKYERAKDYLRWFLDFEKYKSISEFSIHDFKKNSQPIFILGTTVASYKGSEILRRLIDKKSWKIPNGYIRLSNFVFPAWFRELGLLDKIYVFPEFSHDKKLWHMIYPVKMKTKEFLELDGASILESMFLKNKERTTIWIPYLLYVIAMQYKCPVVAIKMLLKNLYKQDYEHFYLERTSLPVMKNRYTYEESYINVDGFFRSTLILKRRNKKNG